MLLDEPTNDIDVNTLRALEAGLEAVSYTHLAALRGSLLLMNHSLGLLVEPRRVVALPWNTFATVQLQNPLAHVVEEVAVVGYGDYGTLILDVYKRQSPGRAPFHRGLGRQRHIRLRHWNAR